MLTTRSPFLARQSTLRNEQRSLRSAVERVAAGVRVQRAADDAAGLGVATNLETALGSLRVARRNIGDALNIVQTAETGLEAITDSLQRMRVLAVQAASETLDDDERAYLHQEFGALQDEIDRISTSTRMGEDALLALPAVDLLLLADVSGSMGAELPQFAVQLPLLRSRLAAAGISLRIGVGEVLNTTARGDSVDGSTMTLRLTDDATAADAALSALSVAGGGQIDPYTVLLDQTGASPLSGTNGPEDHPFAGGAVQRIVLFATDTGQEVALSSATEADVAAGLAAAGFRTYVATRLPTFASTFDGIVSRTSGRMVHLDSAGANVATLVEAIGDDIIERAGRGAPFSVQVGLDDAAEDQIVLPLPVDVGTLALEMADVGVDTLSEAMDALEAIDLALDVVSEAAGNLGATHNRLESAYSQNVDAELALASAESQIRDADLAWETSAMTAAQIRRDASVAARAQAQRIHKTTVGSLLGS